MKLVRMMEKLIITDLSKLKITKIKDWAIHFTYDNEKYLLHGSCCDYEYSSNLYKRIPINNKYELVYIAGECTCDDYIKGEFIKEYYKRTLVYNQIDKEYFVNQLVKWEFAEYEEPKIVGIENNLSQKSKRQEFIKQYDYRSNLEKLKKRYENKIEELQDIKNFKNGNELTTVGIEIGLETAIHDIEDILDGLEM